MNLENVTEKCGLKMTDNFFPPFKETDLTLKQFTFYTKSVNVCMGNNTELCGEQQDELMVVLR